MGLGNSGVEEVRELTDLMTGDPIMLSLFGPCKHFRFYSEWHEESLDRFQKRSEMIWLQVERIIQATIENRLYVDKDRNKRLLRKLLLLFRVNFIECNYFRSFGFEFYNLNSMNTNVFYFSIYLKRNYFQESYIKTIFDPQIFKTMNQIHELISVIIYVCNIL